MRVSLSFTFLIIQAVLLYVHVPSVMAVDNKKLIADGISGFKGLVNGLR